MARQVAVAYLAASGAAAISIIERDGAGTLVTKDQGAGSSVVEDQRGGCTITTGKLLPKSGVISTWWTAATIAPEIASRARLEAGPDPDPIQQPPQWSRQRPP